MLKKTRQPAISGAQADTLARLTRTLPAKLRLDWEKPRGAARSLEGTQDVRAYSRRGAARPRARFASAVQASLSPRGAPGVGPAQGVTVAPKLPLRAALVPTPGGAPESVEHIDPVALDVEGEIPPEVRGFLMFNGPGNTRIGTTELAHPFDGDAKVKKVALYGANAATYQSRFVRTELRDREQANNRMLASRFGTLCPRTWRNALSLPKVAAAPNINCIRLAGKIYAVGDGSWLYELDPATLATRAKTDLGLGLGPGSGFLSHPKRQPGTGDLLCLVLHSGLTSTLSIFRFPADFAGGDVAAVVKSEVRVDLPFTGLVHDSAATPRRLVIALGPYKLRLHQFLLHRKTLQKSFEWCAEDSTEILSVNLDQADPGYGKLSRYRYTGAPLLPIHHHTAREEPDGLSLDVFAYPDSAIIDALVQRSEGPVIDGARWKNIHVSAAGEVSCRSLNGKDIELARSLGHATVAGHEAVAFGVSAHAGARGGTTITRYQREGGHQTLELAAHESCSEPIPVAKLGGGEGAWVLVLVSNIATQKSWCCIYDGDDFAAPPRARMRLPEYVPLGQTIHGAFFADDGGAVG